MEDVTLRVLLIEDNPADARLIQETLKTSPRYEIVSADRLSSGLAHLAGGNVDVVLLDLSLPDSQGLEALFHLRANAPQVPVVVLTGLDDDETAIEAMQAGAQDYLVKGQDSKILLTRSLRYAIERKRLEERIYYLATHDALTNLPNRVLFYDRLNHGLARADRNRDKSGENWMAAVLMLDLDHFKIVNDTLGHTKGDEVLRMVAERLAGCMRKSDTIARLGGDEFVILIEGTADSQDCATVAQKILGSLAQPFVVEGREFLLGVSIGISLYPADGEDGETLFKHADIALYRAKELHSRYELYRDK